MILSLVESIKLLSSGTLGSIFNLSNYDEIENKKKEFLDFASSLPQNLSWQKAFKLYSK